jgi:hypothetical protein
MDRRALREDERVGRVQAVDDWEREEEAKAEAEKGEGEAEAGRLLLSYVDLLVINLSDSHSDLSEKERDILKKYCADGGGLLLNCFSTWSVAGTSSPHRIA